MGLTLRQLYYFVAIVKAGSLTKAAGVLHVAPTALSLQIKAMEEDFSVTLLRRHSRGIDVTLAGEDLYTRAQGIIALVETTEAAMRGAKAAMPRCLRLGAPPAIARLIGADAVYGAQERFPGVTIDLFQDWSSLLERKLRLDELDVVVGYGLQSDDTILAIPLQEDEMVFAAAPKIAGGTRPIALAEALAKGLVFYGADSVGWRATVEAAMQAHLPPPPEVHVNSIDLWRAMLCRGMGSTITSFNAIADEHARGQIVVRAIADYPIRRHIATAYRLDTGAREWAVAFSGFIGELISAAQSKLSVAVSSPHDDRTAKSGPF